MNDFPYSVPERRSLTTEEKEILRLILSQTAPDRLLDLDNLEVHARCGCGKCPTIMFHSEPEKRKEEERIIADYQGVDEIAGRVGVMLWERDGNLSELEAWSIEGTDIVTWPEISSLNKFDQRN